MPAIAIAFSIPGMSVGKVASIIFPNYLISTIYLLKIHLPTEGNLLLTKGHERKNL